jgi:hypothetical protein
MEPWSHHSGLKSSLVVMAAVWIDLLRRRLLRLLSLLLLHGVEHCQLMLHGEADDPKGPHKGHAKLVESFDANFTATCVTTIMLT